MSISLAPGEYKLLASGNHWETRPKGVDEETARLLFDAEQCHRSSGRLPTAVPLPRSPAAVDGLVCP
jgi:hypothetical protein